MAQPLSPVIAPFRAPDPADELARLHLAMKSCTRCPELVKSRNQVVPGDGNLRSKIVFVGEAPGEQEDRKGIPFVGAAGQLLDQLLKEIGLDRKQIFITNVVKCRPEKNRDPLPTEIAECREHIYAQLLLLDPAVVCTLGRFALNTVVREDLRIGQVHGRPVRIHGITFFPIYHPAAALHNESTRDDLVQDFVNLQAFLKSVGLG